MYKYFLKDIVPMIPNKIEVNDLLTFKFITISTLAVVNLIPEVKVGRKKVRIEEYLMDDYGLSLENFEYLKTITKTPLIFFGTEWKYFIDDLAIKNEIHLPWHLIANLNTDFNICIGNDFKLNKSRVVIINNNDKNKIDLTADSLESVYNIAKSYISDYLDLLNSSELSKN